MNKKIKKLLSIISLIIYTSTFIVINELVLRITSHWYYINFTYKKLEKHYAQNGEIMPPSLFNPSLEDLIYEHLDRYNLLNFILFESALIFIFIFSVLKLKKIIINFKKLTLYSILISFISYFVLTPEKINSLFAFTGPTFINNLLSEYAIIVRIILIFISCIITINLLSKKK